MTSSRIKISKSARTRIKKPIGVKRLSERRRLMKNKRTALVLVLSVFLVIIICIGLWQPRVRVSHIIVTTGDTGIAMLAREAISGTYARVVPKDSIIFLAKDEIRKIILSARPDIATVSISRTGFNSIVIRPLPRVPLALWCGGVSSSTPANTLELETTPTIGGDCYFFDGSGFVFQQVFGKSSSTTIASENINDIPLVSYKVYSQLVSVSSSSTIGASVKSAGKFPNVFDFARKIKTLGARVKSVVLRADEVDFFLDNGTRITYVLGDEQNAFSLLYAVRNKISLSDGSLSYVDLRFKGKVYFKKRVR